MLPTFVAAAEIVRYYQANGKGASWSSADISKFDGFVNNLKNNHVNNSCLRVEWVINNKFVNNLKNNYVNNVPAAINDVNNWQASYCYAKMAAGVWLNSTAVYDAGYDYMQAHMDDLIRADGNVNECGRDCHHLQYTLCALTYAAETARIQGSTAFYASVARLSKTAEASTRSRSKAARSAKAASMRATTPFFRPSKRPITTTAPANC